MKAVDATASSAGAYTSTYICYKRV